MTKALKIVLATYGIGLTLVGLSYLFLPEEMSEFQGAEELSAFLVGTKMVLGASLVAVGVFVVIAAQDPIRQILWVRFAIVFALLFLTVSIYLGAVVKAEFRDALEGVLIHGIFAALLLILYPRQTVPGAVHAGSLDRINATGTIRGM